MQEWVWKEVRNVEDACVGICVCVGVYVCVCIIIFSHIHIIINAIWCPIIHHYSSSSVNFILQTRQINLFMQTSTRLFLHLHFSCSHIHDLFLLFVCTLSFLSSFFTSVSDALSSWFFPFSSSQTNHALLSYFSLKPSFLLFMWYL